MEGCRFAENRYDLRKVGRLSPARKQAWGTCWSHGVMSSIESNLMTTGVWLESGEKGEADLSEYHMDKFNGFNRQGETGNRQKGWYSGQGPDFSGSNTDDLSSGVVVHLGGDYQMAAAWLSNSLGAVQERLTPTILSDNNGHDLFGDNDQEGVLKKNGYTYFFPKHIEWLTRKGSVVEKRNKIKEAIKKFGAVASGQKMINTPVGYTSDGAEIHVNLKESKLDHSISLVGWDDKFIFKGMTGAWIVKDSDHKKESSPKREHIGHFYLMYDDIHAGKEPMMGGVVFRDISIRKNIEIYSHSMHGWRYETDENFFEVANQFKAVGNEKLVAVGIYTLRENTSFNVRIYKNSKLVWQQNGNEKFPGFHYVPIMQPMNLSRNDQFKVALSYDNSGYAYDASFEMELLLGKLPPWGSPVIVHSKAQKGQSFYRKNSKAQWDDFHGYLSRKNKQTGVPHARNNKTANFAINAYTRVF